MNAFALSFLSYYSWYSCYTAPPQFDLCDCAPCEIALNRIWPKHYGWTFVFIRRMWATVMVNNYDLGIQQRRGSRMLSELQREKSLHERAGPWCLLFPLCAGAPQAYQQKVFSILSILWVRGLPVPTPSFHYSSLHMCIGGERKTYKKKQRKGHSQIRYLLESVPVSTKGKWN